jgi:hypothetical protein
MALCMLTLSTIIEIRRSAKNVLLLCSVALSSVCLILRVIMLSVMLSVAILSTSILSIVKLKDSMLSVAF